VKPGLALRGAQWMFWLAGALLCAWSAGTYLDARFRQAMEYRRLEEALRERGPRGLPAAPPETPISRKAGSLVGRLEIPRLKLSAMVLEGSDSGTLSLAVGRVPGTADPGQAGNVVLGGHRDTFFRPLRSIRAGDAVTLVTPRDAYRYVVEWTSIVDPANREPLKATPARSLTLVTCYPFRYIGPAPRRFIVRARQLEPDASVAAHN
jgi:sortase A